MTSQSFEQRVAFDAVHHLTLFQTQLLQPLGLLDEVLVGVDEPYPVDIFLDFLIVI